ncbi:MAG: hypothetical protein A3J46_05785 [Candidatus Yanofskybacteria bacterium RIFCSPHIGHO2_02_FULL_41_11]|uniref:Uncharacterized protein n=1 Tax=Candidatus Yanofskybacteria bacterium RIFCSPHIGHO2_02_FULL_41_11 TaxID=1802675 RepID=A0A1F8F620_9BACT|nr:MAG: hypothetical protein A3J46_05785 [Candidatus Yanofskybacteria bacterium RIFCSPHIGHO2_02_FULL_41_11]
MSPQNSPQELDLVAISGLCWPTRSREYLIKLVKEAVVECKAKVAAVVVAGHTIDGKYMETEFKSRLRNYLNEFSPRLKGDDLEWKKQEFERTFIEEQATHLSDFLPVLPNDVNWHIIIAERIYDRPLGARILEKLRDKRSDVRIVGSRQEDGYYDREPKLPIQFPGFETVRVIVPHRSPWFSKVISNLPQRLHNAFAPRTLSPKPDLILTGVTGTSVYLPYYDGVPNISVPDLNKLLEQQATEHMIGATIIRILANGKNNARIIHGVYNFRTAAFQEKVVSVPASLPKVQQAVMRALVPSDASFKAILHRANTNKNVLGRKVDFTEESVKETLSRLIKNRLVVFSKASNRYGINENLRRNAKITLESLQKDSRSVKHVVWSCFHGGASKTLYFTALNDIPKLAHDSDAIYVNGDLVQGIAHQFEYSGELLPIANGTDKQEIITAHCFATILLDIFRNRLEQANKTTKNDAVAILKKCLIPFIYNAGNHDKWSHHNRMALILQLFEDRLRLQATEGVLSICKEKQIAVTYEQVASIVNTSIIRVGESRMVELDGITVGIKHPHKGRTIQKSTRIQEVVDFIWRRFDSYMQTVAKNSKGFSIAYVANFHEAAAVHVTKFGQTVLGVMTGAYLKDTEFETNMDKVVDYGPAIVTVKFDSEGRLLYSETEFVSRIDEEDREFVLSDRIDSNQVLKRCEKLLDRINLKLPWR